ncbi:MAG: hypothetical protein KDB90_01655 [Planctomycetes bacterium]|nr:hypothetical protein [Planctomycetota bacterium]
MPEQAILDLPVIEFERHIDSLGRLHAQCIESYGLTGFRPHPDAAFHFSASLWRYRADESLSQVAALATFYLRALSTQVAARRRVAAIRSAMDEKGGAAMRSRLAEADEDLAAAQEGLNDITRHVGEFVEDYLVTREQNVAAANERLNRNLTSMGAAGWTDRLDDLTNALADLEDVRIDWSAPLIEVMDDLEALDLPEQTERKATQGYGNGHDLDGGVIARLQSELEQYRTVAHRASSRLQQVDSERHQLEALLQDTEGDSANRALALEEARQALEVTLVDARERLDRMERNQSAELKSARREIAELKAERDRLAAELLHALESSTETESSQEELIEQLEGAAGDRLEAANALSALSRRLEEIQGDAETAAEQTDILQARVIELEQSLAELGDELSHSEERTRQAEATIQALESGAGQSDEFDAILTESEERLADTQEALSDAQLRADGLAGQLEDRDYELKRAHDRVEAQKKTIDSISVQLAEAETLADEHDARIVALERENERLRRDLSDSQSKMLDAKGDVEEARGSAESARVELQRLKDRLDEEKGKSSTMSTEGLELRKNLRARDEEVISLREELADAQQRAKRAEKQAEDSGRKARHLADETALLNDQAESDQATIERLRGEVKAALDTASAHRSDYDGLTRETDALRVDLDRARAEYEALRNSSNTGAGQKSALTARTVELEQQVAALRAELDAERDLAADRTRKADERLALARTRADNAEHEARTLQETLEQTQQARSAERGEFEALVAAERGRVRTDEGALGEAKEELEKLKARLNESEAFLIKRQREFERAENQLKSMLEEIRGVADLRLEYEKGEPGKKRDEIASQIGRRIDALFAAAGKPVHADRKTEKLVIFTVKKSDEELAEEADKPFVATNKRQKKSSDKPSES